MASLSDIIIREIEALPAQMQEEGIGFTTKWRNGIGLMVIAHRDRNGWRINYQAKGTANDTYGADILRCFDDEQPINNSNLDVHVETGAQLIVDHIHIDQMNVHIYTVNVNPSGKKKWPAHAQRVAALMGRVYGVAIDKEFYNPHGCKGCGGNPQSGIVFKQAGCISIGMPSSYENVHLDIIRQGDAMYAKAFKSIVSNPRYKNYAVDIDAENTIMIRRKNSQFTFEVAYKGMKERFIATIEKAWELHGQMGTINMDNVLRAIAKEKAQQEKS